MSGTGVDDSQAETAKAGLTRPCLVDMLSRADEEVRSHILCPWGFAL